MHISCPVKCIIVVEIIIFSVLFIIHRLLPFALFTALSFLWEDHFKLLLYKSVTAFTWKDIRFV